MNAAHSFQGLVFAGESSAARQLRLQVSRMAPYFRSALLVGERGTGKAEVARALHRLSPVAKGEFRSAHAAAVSDTDLAHTASGTLYLLHVERLTLAEQDRLLRQLDRQTERVRGSEMRLICASSCELRGMVSSGRMREGFYNRIAGLEIRLAPLRDRLEDLPEMLAGWKLDSGVQAGLNVYGWPGNVHEFAQMLSRAAADSPGHMLFERHVPTPAPGLAQGFSPGITAGLAMEKLDVVLHRYVADVLERCAGNKLRAAETLGISRSTLYRMLESPPA